MSHERPQSDYIYACRMCRRVLFTDAEIVPHSSDPQSKGNKAFHQRDGGVLYEERAASCTSYFLDPDVSPWVSEESREVHRRTGGAEVSPDTIHCPNAKCNAKIGTQSWVGSQCSCGAWVTPSFKIHSRAVDKVLRS